MLARAVGIRWTLPKGLDPREKDEVVAEVVGAQIEYLGLLWNSTYRDDSWEGFSVYYARIDHGKTFAEEVAKCFEAEATRLEGELARFTSRDQAPV